MRDSGLAKCVCVGVSGGGVQCNVWCGRGVKAWKMIENAGSGCICSKIVNMKYVTNDITKMALHTPMAMHIPLSS